jgi:hypothetical protein
MLLSLLLIPLIGLFVILYTKDNILSITYLIDSKKDYKDNPDNILTEVFTEIGEKNSTSSRETTFLSTKFLDDKQEYNNLSSMFSPTHVKSIENSTPSKSTISQSVHGPSYTLDNEEIVTYLKHCTQKLSDLYKSNYLCNSNSFKFLSGNYYRNTVKLIALCTSILNLFISLIIFILFDFSTNQLQFVQDYHEITFFNLYLGIDGLSIYFILLTTIIIPISLLSN